MMRGWKLRALSALVVVAGTVSVPLGVGQAASAGPGHTAIPSAVPGLSPHIDDGQVNAIVKVGDTVIVGGQFSSARPPQGGASVPRQNILAYDSTTGRIKSSFAPTPNGVVQDLEPGPTAGTVYVAGKFSRVDGANHNKVALLDVATGAPVAGFKASAANGSVNSVARHGERLFVGGWFTTVGGAEHRGLAALDATTGRVDPYVSVQVAENHNTSGWGATSPVGVRELDVTSAGDRLVAIGNFRTVDGQDRDQVVMLTLGAASASVTSDWQTNRYKPLCFSWAFDHYVRGVDFSPDGSYFVVGTTGGGNTGTLCDAAARFETHASSTDLQPTWVDYTGGDTLWAVEITETAVYVGGHQRWMNNPLASDRAGAGAVPRPGLAALSTETGLPLAWNPGRHPRGLAVFDLYAADDGLYLGSDTDYIGNFEYGRGKIAHFPLATGVEEADDTTASLPGTVLVGNGDSLSAMSFDGVDAGPLTSTDPMGFDWDDAKGAFLSGGDLYYAATDGNFYRRSFDGTSLGTPESFTPWDDPYWAGVLTGSHRRTYDGLPSQFYSQISEITSLTYADGRLFYTLDNDTGLYSRYFNVDSGIVGAEEVTLSSRSRWRSVTSSFIGGDDFYYVNGNNDNLYSVPLASVIDGTVPTGTLVTTQGLGGTAFLSSNAALTNEPPAAAFTHTCDELGCSFDGSGSSDPDGTVVDYEWDFGDGNASNTVAAQHAFGAAGTYDVTLTVTDNLGQSASVSKAVSVVDVTNALITQVAADGQAWTSSASTVTVPAEVQSEDLLLLSLAVGGDRTVPAPTGWTQVDRQSTIGLTTYVWTRTATADDADSAVALDLPAVAKSALTVSAYRGAGGTVSLATHATSVDAFTTDHLSPGLVAPPQSMVVSLWMDKGPSTSDWIEPAGTHARAEVLSTKSGRVSTLVVDGGAAQAGPVGNLTATTDATSSRSVAWTIALVP